MSTGVVLGAIVLVEVSLRIGLKAFELGPDVSAVDGTAIVVSSGYRNVGSLSVLRHSRWAGRSWRGR
jgi:hypothetical protein